MAKTRLTVRSLRHRLCLAHLTAHRNRRRPRPGTASTQGAGPPRSLLREHRQDHVRAGPRTTLVALARTAADAEVPGTAAGGGRLVVGDRRWTAGEAAGWQPDVPLGRRPLDRPRRRLCAAPALARLRPLPTAPPPRGDAALLAAAARPAAATRRTGRTRAAPGGRRGRRVPVLRSLPACRTAAIAGFPRGRRRLPLLVVDSWLELGVKAASDGAAQRRRVARRHRPGYRPDAVAAGLSLAPARPSRRSGRY